MKQILVVEDTPSLLKLFEAVLSKNGHSVILAGTAAQGLSRFRQTLPEVMILDLMLPDGDGLKLMSDCLRLSPRTNVIVVTANRSVATAVEAMRSGAFDFLVKPFDSEQLLQSVRNAASGFDDPPATRPPNSAPMSRFCGLVGASSGMQTVYDRIRSAARSMATVFVAGEAGTGKEICARAVHDCSPRAGGPFLRLRCGAIAPERQESELFGHLRGAFVGALSDRTGAFVAADGGTLFIDDICEMEPAVQTKLLRFLQTDTVQPIGSARPRNVDVRIVCATDRDPIEEVRLGRFRQDLFYRLHVVPITMPPLREREQDVLAIAEESLKRLANAEGKRFTSLDEATKRAFLKHDWPGNVRQLKSVLHNITVLHDGERVTRDMLPMESGFPAQHPDGSAATPTNQRPSPAELADAFAGMTFAEIERHLIEACIARHAGSVPQAARELDLSPSTIYRKRTAWAQQ